MKITETLKRKIKKGLLEEIKAVYVNNKCFNMKDTYISHDGCGSWTLISAGLALNENAFNSERKPYKIDMVTHSNNNYVYKLEDSNLIKKFKERCEVVA